MQGDVRDAGSIPGLGGSPGGGHGNALQYSCLENLMDRGAWRGLAVVWLQIYLEEILDLLFLKISLSFLLSQE